MEAPIDKLLDEVVFHPVENSPSKNGMPYVTHEGILNMGEIEIKVYVLNDGRRIIPESEFKKIFGE